MTCKRVGLPSSIRSDGFNVRDLVNRFLTAKQHLVDAHELTQRTFKDYYSTCELVITLLGKSRLVCDLPTDDFENLRVEFAKTRRLVALGNLIRMTRIVFQYAFDADLIER